MLAAKLGLFISDPTRRVRISVAATLTTPADAADAVATRTLAEAMQSRGLRTL